MVLLEREGWLAVDGESSVLLERRRLNGLRMCRDVRELSRRRDSRRVSDDGANVVSLELAWLLRGMLSMVAVDGERR